MTDEKTEEIIVKFNKNKFLKIFKETDSFTWSLLSDTNSHISIEVKFNNSDDNDESSASYSIKLSAIRGHFVRYTELLADTLQDVATIIEDHLPFRYCTLCERLLCKNNNELCDDCEKNSIFTYKKLGECTICTKSMKFGIYKFPCGHIFHIHCCQSLSIKQSDVMDITKPRMYIECPLCRYCQDLLEFKLSIE
jgi:hypothetical protein